MRDIPEYLTVSEVSQIFKRHPQTVRLAVQENMLHGEQPTGKRGHYRIELECAKHWNRGEPCGHKIRSKALNLEHTSNARR